MVLHPVGPEPPHVYWRRRFILLAIVAVLLFALTQRFGGDDDTVRTRTDTSGASAAEEQATPPATATPTAARSVAATPPPADTPTATAEPTSTEPSPTPTPTPTEPTPAKSPSPKAVALCSRDALQVDVRAHARAYPAGTTPQLSLSVTNTSARPCRIDVGPRATELILTSGGQPTWSSDDCDPRGASGVRALRPDERWQTTVAWPRKRTAAGCEDPIAPALPGTYVLVGRVGEIRGGYAVITLR